MIIPAYNEEARVARVVRAVLEQRFPVAVADDGSTDRTVAEVRSLGVVCLETPSNRGKGATVRRALDWFMKQSFRAAVLMDADGQHDPAELPVFLAALEAGADLAIGDRLRAPGRMSLLRRATNRSMSALLSLASGLRVPDTQCGYRALTREALAKMRLRTERFEIESEMVLEAGRNGLRVVAVPIRSVYAGEISRIRPLRDTRRFARFLFAYLTEKH